MDKDIGNAEYFDKEDLRFATPVKVADYRARRLKCNKIVDLCSGIGIQSGSFAKTCKQVFGFEIDGRKVEYAKKNFSEFRNVNFFVGDVLSKEIIDKIREIKPDVIFCDPERLAKEKERTLDSIKPNLKKLISIYSKICPYICIEIPPQMDLNKLKELGSFEAEYLSLDNRLNRLDLYFGDLKKCDVSVAEAFSGERIEKNKEIRKPRKTNRIMKYLYEVSPAIEKAGVENEFADEIGALVLKGCEKGKLLLSSDEISGKLKSFYKIYRVFYITSMFNDINIILRKKGFGKVVLKYSIDPKNYWKERNRIENLLKGDKETVVFVVNGRYVLCEEI